MGQARLPFGRDSLAIDSTVICGGEAGRAYVGYRAAEMQRTEGVSQRTYIPWPGQAWYSPERFAEYQKGDLDAVRLQPDGTVALEEHIWRTTGASNDTVEDATGAPVAFGRLLEGPTHTFSGGLRFGLGSAREKPQTGGY